MMLQDHLLCCGFPEIWAKYRPINVEVDLQQKCSPQTSESPLFFISCLGFCFRPGKKIYILLPSYSPGDSFTHEPPQGWDQLLQVHPNSARWKTANGTTVETSANSTVVGSPGNSTPTHTEQVTQTWPRLIENQRSKGFFFEKWH